MYGYDPVLAGDEVVGYVTSGEYGYSVGKFLAYAYVPVEHAANGRGRRIGARLG